MGPDNVHTVSPTSDGCPVNRAADMLASIALATGCRSGWEFVLRCLGGICVTTIVQHLFLYPGAAVAFDIAISVAAVGIMQLLAFFMVRAQSGW